MKPSRFNTRDEVAAALDFLWDNLEDQGLNHFQEQTDENHDTWTIGAVDREGGLNTGFVGWDDQLGAVTFAAFDTVQAKHDQDEGVTGSDTKPWWCPKDAEMFLMHLDGRARAVVRMGQRILLAGGDLGLDRAGQPAETAGSQT